MPDNSGAKEYSDQVSYLQGKGLSLCALARKKEIESIVPDQIVEPLKRVDMELINVRNNIVPDEAKIVETSDDRFILANTEPISYADLKQVYNPSIQQR